MKRDFQVEEDLNFEVAEQRVSFAAWLIISITMGSAFLFTGGGPFSRVTVQQGSMRAEYERVIRQDSPAELLLNFSGTHAAIAADYLSRFTIEQIVPAPQSVYRDGERLRFEFKQAPGAVRWVLEPHKVGMVTARLRSPDAELEFRQLVLP